MKEGQATASKSIAMVNAWPRGLRRPDAARYVGVGLTKFDEMVLDGRMPKAKLVDGCVIWDRTRLDDAFDSLPDQDEKLDRGRWKTVGP